MLDASEATGVNDPEYESWYAPFRRQIVSGFRGVAVVLKTASGRLQARRLAQDDRQRGLAFVGTIEEADEDLDRR